jgi:nitrate reductase assembly molybdenum cofactor insertion protein NarJ
MADPVDTEGDDQFDPEEFEEMPDPMEALAAFLSTDDGETIATSLAGLKDTTALIAKHLEKQNLILVKILTALGNSKCDCGCKPTPA